MSSHLFHLISSTIFASYYETNFCIASVRPMIGCTFPADVERRALAYTDCLGGDIFSALVPQQEPPNQPDAHPSGCAPRCGGGRPSGGGEPMRGTPPLSLGAAAACPPPRRQGAWGASHALFFRRWSPTQASQTPLPGAGPRPKRRTHPPSRRLGAWGGVSVFRMPSMRQASCMCSRERPPAASRGRGDCGVQDGECFFLSSLG